jgi:hypothetical protein
VSVSRFWRAEFSFCVENIVLFLRRYCVRTYQKSTSFVPAGTDLGVKLLTVEGLVMGGRSFGKDKIELLVENTMVGL